MASSQVHSREMHCQGHTDERDMQILYNSAGTSSIPN